MNEEKFNKMKFKYKGEEDPPIKFKYSFDEINASNSYLWITSPEKTYTFDTLLGCNDCYEEEIKEGLEITIQWNGEEETMNLKQSSH
ncbi:hypothetical protein [Halobacillus mangrovi]|uniref:hypothetical protein n=1 Tax=Halobacillus mangrovi TaxID=402384 RepID=UPI003D9884E1